MMAEKAKLFGNVEIHEKIIECKSPAAAKKLGRQVKNFNQEIWKKHRFEIVKQANQTGKTVKSLPKGGALATGKKKEEYDNTVSNIVANRKIARSTLNIPTKNYNTGSGLQLPT